MSEPVSPEQSWTNSLKEEEPVPAVDPTRSGRDQKGFFRFVKETGKFFWRGIEVPSQTAAGIIGFTRKVIKDNTKK